MAVREQAAPVVAASVGRSYTRGRKAPYLIRKWPGSRWTLPFGPYTLTQLGVLAGSVYVLVSYPQWWAFFGPLNVVVGVGLPLVLTYAVRRTRIEGRDPLRAAAAWLGYLTQSRTGYLGGRAWRPPRRQRMGGGVVVVAELPADLAAVAPLAPVVGLALRPAPPRGSVADLIAAAGRAA
jgi:hypothetical protein